MPRPGRLRVLRHPAAERGHTAGHRLGLRGAWGGGGLHRLPHPLRARDAVRHLAGRRLGRDRLAAGQRTLVRQLFAEGATEYEARGGAWRGQFRGPLWRFVDERLADAQARGLSALEVCDEWRSGACLLETVPSVLYILARHGAGPEEAIVRAVNDTWDNDTIAAVVGAAVGALHGASALPAPWVEQLPGYTRFHDEGEVRRIVQRARQRWG
ncbi:MAG: hypothetical protein GX624_06375 [Actinobacteria bacterium]|nr:hypothetical protein [Actinomycetota bacterium]